MPVHARKRACSARGHAHDGAMRWAFMYGYVLLSIKTSHNFTTSDPLARQLFPCVAATRQPCTAGNLTPERLQRERPRLPSPPQSPPQQEAPVPPPPTTRPTPTPTHTSKPRPSAAPMRRKFARVLTIPCLSHPYPYHHASTQRASTPHLKDSPYSHSRATPSPTMQDRHLRARAPPGATRHPTDGACHAQVPARQRGQEPWRRCRLATPGIQVWCQHPDRQAGHHLPVYGGTDRAACNQPTSRALRNEGQSLQADVARRTSKDVER